MTEKRFINDIDYGQLIDTKGELSTIDYSDTVDFYELWEFLNKLNDENEQLNHECNYLQNRLDDFINIQKENEQLKQQLTDCKEKKQQMKEFFMNSEPVIEQKKLQKVIYQTVINLIDEKIDEFKNGDYGDLPCNTIHMFLDLKQEIGDVE